MVKTYEIDLDDALVDSASGVFETIGIDIDTAVNMFLKRAVLEKGFPVAFGNLENSSEDAVSESAFISPSENIPVVSQEITEPVMTGGSLGVEEDEIDAEGDVSEFDEEDEDETTPDNLFAAWDIDAEDEIAGRV